MNKVLTKLEKAIEGNKLRVAVSDGGKTWSYSDLGSQISQVRTLLCEAGLGQNLKIGIVLKNSAHYLSSYYGAMAGDCVPCLIDRESNRSELTSIHNSCGISHFIVEQNALQKFPLEGVRTVLDLSNEVVLVSCSHVPDSTPSTLADTVTCRFTSGSTGEPKCLEFSDQAIVSAALNWQLGTSLKREDKSLCIAAISNGLAFNTSLLSTFMAGAELHLYTGLMMAARIMDVMDDKEITRLIGFPAIYQHIVRHERQSADRRSSLKIAISASAILDADIRQKFVQKFGISISDYYGIAETGPVTFEPDTRVNDGLGTPLPGAALRIVDAPEGEIGEVQVKTSSFASRYLNRTDDLRGRLTSDGFYRSDDLGAIRHGRLFLCGKTNNSANIGGRKIYTHEVTSLIQGMAGVSDAEVFVDQDKNGLDVLHAVVVASPSVTREAIVRFCQSNVASYKIPPRITFVAQIPRSGVGKTTHNKLTELTRQDSF